MNHIIHNLHPSPLWTFFEKINQIPRGSKNEQQISNYLVQFGQNLNLPTYQDSNHNVIIRKNASKGLENKPTIILQAHLDMVHQKNNHTKFDFLNQGIEMYVDGDWIKANGTTLGADNGIGVAAIMAILSNTSLQHPAIEALFTTDEETGMTGAFELKPNLLSGKYLLNLDSENDTELTIGCAGGVDVTAILFYEPILSSNPFGFDIQLTGLQGGHSGMDIHKKHGNSIKILNSILTNLNQKTPIYLSQINGGTLRNAIPREASAQFTCKNTTHLFVDFEKKLQTIKNQWISTEPNLQISLHPISPPKQTLNLEDSNIILQNLENCLSGVFSMDQNIPQLVETSNNLAIVNTTNNQITIKCLARSSNQSTLDELKKNLHLEFKNMKVTYSSEYPGWLPNPNNPLTTITKNVYKKLFGHPPIISACHAGLECGIIAQHYPNLEMISFGPNIIGAHTPNEKVSIHSTQKFWHFLTQLLQELSV